MVAAHFSRAGKVAHSARQINGHTMCMSKQSDLGVRVTHNITNGWLIVLRTHRPSRANVAAHRYLEQGDGRGRQKNKKTTKGLTLALQQAATC